MIRMILTILLPLVAPTIIYFLLMRLKAKWKKEDEAAAHVPLTHKLPWFRLIGAGGILLALVLIVFGFPSYEGFKGKYVPPHVENGVLIPGQFVEEKAAE